MSEYPAPWRVNAWLPANNANGEYIFSVAAWDGAVVLEDCGQTVAVRVVEARNAGADALSAEAVQAKLREDIAFLLADAEKARKHFRAEVGTYAEALDRATGRGQPSSSQQNTNGDSE